MFPGRVIAVVCSVFACITFTMADVIMPDYHYVGRCATISNLDEYPDIVVIGGYTEVGNADKISRYVVKSDSCLTKGYKFNTFYLFWAEETYLDSIGLENMPLEMLLGPVPAKRRNVDLSSLRMGLITTGINPAGTTVPDSNPVVSEQLIYRIDATSDGEGFTTTLAEKISTDKDGEETRETFIAVGTLFSRQPAANPASVKCTARLGKGTLLFSPVFNGPASAELIDCRGRTAVRFTRECRAGCTYLIRSSAFSAGIYWLRVKSGTAIVTLPVSTFK